MLRTSRAFQLRQQFPLSQPTRLSRRTPSRRFWNRSNGNSRVQANVQPVRFRSPGFTWKKAVTWSLYVALPYFYIQFLFRHIDIQIEEIEEGVEHEQHEEEGEWEEQEESDEDEFADEESTFIPMTWMTKLPRSFYKGSDPEWQEFVKIAKDRPRHKKIQNDLVQLVYGGAQKHPRVGMQVGKDLKVGRYWLELSFPDGPPQEYVRSGLEIGDDFIAWSPQRVSPETHHRLSRALWPTATFGGIWTTAMVYTGIQYRRLKQALGWEQKNPFSLEERFKVALETMEKGKQQTGRGGSPVGENAQTSPNGSPGSLVSASSAAAEAQSSPKDAEGRIPLPFELSLPMPSKDAVDLSDFQLVKHVFTVALMRNWAPKKMEPPRGSFVVQGLVELKGSKGRIMFDVQSCYDPKECKFVFVNAGVRSIKHWRQAPKGGD